MAIAVHLAILFQFSGIHFVATYASQLSDELASGETSLILPPIINFIEIPALFLSFVLNRHFGRKTILIFGTIVSFLANLIVSIYFYVLENSHTGNVLLYIGVFLFLINFGLTLDPVIFLYIPEIIGPKLISFAMASYWIAATLTITLFPIFTDDYLNNNPGAFFIFSAAFCFISIFIIYFFLVETKDKT